ncbi:MAG TPA: 4-hydroxy-3-methylbut-2-en-1-yl diphosphate synthase [Lentisphaeria bacterium]|nr:MAG: 4-hydroxy-3-methylbut-2-en-1-yl diphosphate synthase [Lentisphaerae bacterium GWF2_50_93]HCE45923.1 4-hydroxy-3-methylbut-2-en-1-yl diphosphate synthase [Lentisphaeria bacterium]
MAKRSNTRRIYIGRIPVGGASPVTVQSMTNTDTRDSSATIRQIRKLAESGCDIIRVAVPDIAAAGRLPEILEKSPIPVIADIHFDFKLALASIDAGVAGIRINPGNIGDEKKVRAIAEAAGAKNIPIRVGANAGSLPREFLSKLGGKRPHDECRLAEALVKSALNECRILEKFGFRDIKVSLKASSVPVTVMAYRKFSGESDYPLHVGITEAGTLVRGTIKSAVGIGALLLDGIGDTIRVSLTADPVEEVKTGIIILESAGLRKAEPELVSCPTCGRTEIDLMGLVHKVESEIEKIRKTGTRIKLKKLAVMGCVVNGPGEARDADFGIAGAKKSRAAVFMKGRLKGIYSEAAAMEMLRIELEK